MDLPPNIGQSNVVNWEIRINNQPLTQQLRVLGIYVIWEVNKIPKCKLILSDGDPSEENFEVSNQPWFAPGQSIEILMGYGTAPSPIFKGIVISQQLKVRSQSAKLIVDCRHPIFKMSLSPKQRHFENLTDEDIIGQILSQYQLNYSIDSTTLTFPELIQFETTDWDFLLARVKANGFLCIVGQDEVNIAALILHKIL